MTEYNDRIAKHKSISSTLAALHNKELEELLSQSKTIYDGIGGSAKIIKIGENEIFVKSIPLTELERRPENINNLGNIFNLPLYCHYGVGSPGFSAWREINLHELTTNWVLSNQCIHFPILYHWREIPSDKTRNISLEDQNEIQEQIKYWDCSIEVGNRIRQKLETNSQILLFLELIPHTLYDWIGMQLKQGTTDSIKWIQDDLKHANSFMYQHGLIHFDAHFENLLTDGKNVYYTDFGLSLSRSFQLTEEEEQFMLKHKNYDEFSTLTNFLHAIVTNAFAADQWELRLKEYINGELGEMLLNQYLEGKQTKLDAWADEFVRLNGPAVLRMDKFYRNLQHKSKSTPYPAEELEQLRGDFNSGTNRS